MTFPKFAFVAAAFCVFGCAVDEGEPVGGTIALRGLSAYEGKYAYFAAPGSQTVNGMSGWVIGAATVVDGNRIVGKKVVNETVVFPAWVVPDEEPKYLSRLTATGDNTLQFSWACISFLAEETNTYNEWNAAARLTLTYVDFVNGSVSGVYDDGRWIDDVDGGLPLSLLPPLE